MVSLTLQFKIELAHGNPKGLVHTQWVSELQGKGVVVYLAKNYCVGSLLLLLQLEAVLSQDEVLDRGLLHPPSEVQGIRLESLVPPGCLVAEDPLWLLTVDDAFVFSEPVFDNVMRLGGLGTGDFELARPTHSHKTTFVLDVGHSGS